MMYRPGAEHVSVAAISGSAACRIGSRPAQFPCALLIDLSLLNFCVGKLLRSCKPTGHHTAVAQAEGGAHPILAHSLHQLRVFVLLKAMSLPDIAKQLRGQIVQQTRP
eukprot:3851120-Rhodomonas_salina.1